MVAQPAEDRVACPSCGSTLGSDARSCLACGAELTPHRSELDLVLHDVARLAARAAGWAVLIGAISILTWMATHGGRPY